MKRWLPIILIIVLLTGCVSGPVNLCSQPTVCDVFTAPETTTTTETIVPDPVVTVPGREEWPPWPGRNGESLGGCGQGLTVEMEEDENGRKYYRYEGGEMCVKYWMEGSGFIVREHGVGFLLFVNGRPQPYRVSEDGEYRYLHQFKEEDYTLLDGYYNGLGWVDHQYRLDIDFLFEPVDGEKGDLIECYIVKMYFPDYSVLASGDGGIRPWTLARSSVATVFKLKYMEDPPKTEPLPVQDRLYDVQISTEVARHEDYLCWTDDDMLKNIRTQSYVNGKTETEDGGMLWEVNAGDEINLRFEIWGSPLVTYRLVYFVNNQPVSVSEEDIVELHVENGKKTVFTAKLDISDFEYESHIYCVLVPFNRLQYTGADGLLISLQMGSYHFLVYKKNTG